MNVEKAVDGLGGDGKASPWLESEPTDHLEQPDRPLASQQHLIAEAEVVCATDHNPQPPIGRQPVIDRLDVRHDLTADRIRSISMVAEQEHQWLTEPLQHNAPVRRAVEIDGRAASGIVVTELGGYRTAQRVTDDTERLQIELAMKPASGGCVQALQSINNELDVGGPGSQKPGDQPIPRGGHKGLGGLAPPLRGDPSLRRE